MKRLPGVVLGAAAPDERDLVAGQRTRFVPDLRRDDAMPGLAAVIGRVAPIDYRAVADELRQKDDVRFGRLLLDGLIGRALEDVGSPQCLRRPGRERVDPAAESEPAGEADGRLHRVTAA